MRLGRESGWESACWKLYGVRRVLHPVALPKRQMRSSRQFVVQQTIGMTCDNKTLMGRCPAAGHAKLRKVSATVTTLRRGARNTANHRIGRYPPYQWFNHVGALRTKRRRARPGRAISVVSAFPREQRSVVVALYHQTLPTRFAAERRTEKGPLERPTILEQ